MKKRIVICADGTWATADRTSPTNVTKFALGVAERGTDGCEQLVFYDEGVGSGRLERIRGGAFGLGLSDNVCDCYRFLVDHFEPGDEIFLVGFSRGAFTVRSTAGLIRNSGILKAAERGRIEEAYSLYRSRDDAAHPNEIKARLFRRSYSHETPIHVIGVWDTVGSLGIPLNGLRFLNRRWRFHDTQISSRVRHAYQALAIDERRGPFRPTMWTRPEDSERHEGQTLEQVWFAGVHSDVGGGYEDPALADIALLWIVDRAAGAGLDFKDDHFRRSQPSDSGLSDARRMGLLVDPHVGGTKHESRTGLYRLIREHERTPGREPTIEGWIGAEQSIASSARERHDEGVYDYTPPRLSEALAEGVGVTDVEARSDA